MTRAVATFDSPADVRRAVGQAARAGWRATSLCSPAFDEALLHLVGATASPVPGWTLAGGAAGALAGFVLTIGTVRQWPGLIVGGKPLVAMPSFLIIAFVLMILGAAIAAMAAFFAAARRARRSARDACGPATTDDRFTVLFESAASGTDIVAVLRSAGAIECRTL
ncbi:MAG TPA: quinol:electron acceptor oxidoreductase subunit ActD [Vicinamibacterales bacterium]|nr:quinol:electron acceptor oxidoreductase subunit ActD [Vicinamibacterales bacterium]